MTAGGISNAEDYNKSTEENPLAFFEGFYRHNGFRKFYKQFWDNLPYLELPVWEVNKEEGYYIYSDNQSGLDGVVDRKVFFGDELIKKLKSQCIVSLGLIQVVVDSQLAKGRDVSNYLILQLHKIERIISFITKDEELRQHVENLKILEFFHAEILNRYKPLILQSHNDLSESSKEQLLPKENLNQELSQSQDFNEISSNEKSFHKGITGFHWIAGSKLSPNDLYNILVHSNAISNEKSRKADFLLAFTGESITEPLRIPWRLTRGKHHNIRPTIKYILKDLLMTEFKLIEEEPDKLFAQKVAYIFADSNGNQIPNLGQMSQIKNSHPSIPETSIKKELDRKMQK